VNSKLPTSQPHSHVFLAPGHDASERRTWMVIWLCGVMMILEIVGGLLFNSIALIADGLHMSTHAGALLLAALAYTYSRRHADDERFTFGTGKFGDLAGFTSAVILAMIALLIGYEAATRFFNPRPIHFGEAIPIAVLGLLVNLASAWLLGGDHHHDSSRHADHDDADHQHHANEHHQNRDHDHDHHDAEADHTRDHNMRAAVVHVVADAAVSMLVIAGLIAARTLGWLWMDPLAGAIGAVVIASWSWSLIRDTGAILLDVNPDRKLTKRIRTIVEEAGDQVIDLHLWRLGPGHLGAILSVVTKDGRNEAYYRAKLTTLPALSHVTIETVGGCE
jgi:cation diffusion facilitator family transporter